MNAMSRAWKEEREQVIEQAGRVADAVRQQVASNTQTAGPVPRQVVARTAAALMSRYDPAHAGFSGTQGPKFPTPSTTALLLDIYRHEKPGQRDEPLGAAIRHTLDRMALGGLYDQVGGGFHRYSVDEKWLVPHFEKMLYDNGQLLSLYAAAYDTWRDDRHAALYARVVRETADYLLREMRDQTGAFWSAQDAEVNAKEGENYVWTPTQIREALADEDDAPRLTGLALRMYGLERGTNFKDPHHPGAQEVNVLFMPETMSELTAFADGDMGGLMRMRQRINEVLLEVRDRRDQPATDDKVLCAWNGLAIAGLADAGRILDEPRYVQAARDAADAVLEHMSQPDGGLFRTMRESEAKIPAFMEDYAFFVGGLIALDAALSSGKQVGRPSTYRVHAARLMGYARQHFASPTGGYFDTLADQADLFVRTRSTYDGALPSGNSQMAMNHVLLAGGPLGEERHGDAAVSLLRGFAGQLEQSGLGVTHMLRSVWWLHTLAGSSVTGPLTAPATAAAVGPPVVSAEAWPLPDRANAYRVVLTIAEGHHLAANPASDPALVPTTIAAADGGAVEVAYPPGVARRYPFADEPLAVYEGRIEFRVTSAAPVEAFDLFYQACTDSACLEPRKAVVPVR